MCNRIRLPLTWIALVLTVSASEFADTLAIVSERIAVSGNSAGGHLAAVLATIEGFNHPDDDLTAYTFLKFLAKNGYLDDPLPAGEKVRTLIREHKLGEMTEAVTFARCERNGDSEIHNFTETLKN